MAAWMVTNAPALEIIKLWPGIFLEKDLVARPWYSFALAFHYAPDV